MSAHPDSSTWQWHARGSKHKVLQSASSERFPQLPPVGLAEGNLLVITFGLDLQG